MRCLDVILQYKGSSGAQIPDPGTCADSRLRHSTCKQVHVVGYDQSLGWLCYRHWL
jgi:hypothetical protein